MNNNYVAILLITPKNMDVLKTSITYLKKNLGAKKIVGIASEKIKTEIESLNIEYINEDTMFEGLTLDKIRTMIKNRGLNEKRAGWYFQQFLKMAYVYQSTNDYYLTWDADTIALNPINYFESGHPSFIEKKEFHKAYFNTVDKLFDGKVYRVDEKVSYIAENMMFNCRIVKEIIKKIEDNDKIEGILFYEKIINAVDVNDFDSGFSEFETYGNYVRIFYPDLYLSKTFRTLRNGSFFIGTAPEDEQLKWAERDYDIISIEGREYFFAQLSRKKIFRICFRLKNIAKISLAVRSLKRKIQGKEQLDYDN